MDWGSVVVILLLTILGLTAGTDGVRLSISGRGQWWTESAGPRGEGFGDPEKNGRWQAGDATWTAGRRARERCWASARAAMESA